MTYGYSKLNELTTTTAGGGATMVYDGSGRMVSYAAGSVTRMAYAGSFLASETSTGGSILRRYVPGPDADEAVVWYEGSGTADRRFLHADERGSVVAVSDAAGGALAINRYDEFGIPQSTNLGRFQYTGQTWFAELGMYNYKARIYSPTLGRFLQTDPIGYADGINWYNYVGGDPVNRIDPTGMKKCLGSRIERPERESCASFAGPGYSEIIVNADKDGRKLVDSGQGNSQVIIDPKTGLPQIVVTAPLHWVPISTLGSISVRSSSQSSTSYLQSSPCNRFQQQLQDGGGAIVDVGGAITVAGGVATGVSTVVAAGGAITGNVPAAAVGTMGIAAGGAVTDFGGKTMLVGSLIGFAGGTSSWELVRNGSDAIINRLPGPGIIRTGLKKVVDRVAESVPDFRVCR